MYSHPVALRSPLSIALVIIICIGLLTVPYASLLRSTFAQGQGKGAERAARPKPGKPEGTLPDLEEVQRKQSFVLLLPLVTLITSVVSDVITGQTPKPGQSAPSNVVSVRGAYPTARFRQPCVLCHPGNTTSSKNLWLS